MEGELDASTAMTTVLGKWKHYEGRNVNSTPELPKRLLDLRDGTDDPLPNEGRARQQRLAKLENEIAAMADFIADLDRYAEHAKTAPLVGDIVKPFMAHEIARHRATLVTLGARMHQDLLMLRKTS